MQYLGLVILTDFSNRPGHQIKLTGNGTIEGCAFVIRGENSVLKGVFPLQRYEVEIQ